MFFFLHFDLSFLFIFIYFLFYLFSFQGGIHGTPYEKYNRHQSGSDASMRMQRQHGSHSGKPRSSPAQSSRNARCQIDIQALKNQTEIRTTVMVCNVSIQSEESVHRVMEAL